VRTLLIEIGTEEIPASFLEPAKQGFSKLLQDSFTWARISLGEVEVFATPRRIALLAKDVAEQQAESVTVKFGPPWARSFDESGAPTKAAVGFANSQGVTVSDLKRGVKDGIEFVAVQKVDTGRQTAEILPDILRDVITRIPFPKRMRWGEETFEFARPIRWLLVLFGHEPVSLVLADVISGNVTYGHRFLSKGALQILDPSGFMDVLRENHVILKETDRMAVIDQGIRAIENGVHGNALRDEDLLKEILYITEYPYPLKGSFDQAFLALPREVLINVMKSHQRYIPLQSESRELMPCFIFFANTVPKDDGTVIRGNEKVLRARLADAEFFFEEDRKTKLADLYERLSSIVFHVKLGTLKQKADRVRHVARSLASLLGYDGVEEVERAAMIMKADLLTHMVTEFPELQGTMGRIYATYQGESAEVAVSLEEHYLPSGSNGALPATRLGAIMSMADKVDSLVAFFSVGITPTGNLDPYALRRQALGFIRIVIEKRLHLDMERLVDAAYSCGGGIDRRSSLEETKSSLTEFIVTRFKFLMVDENHNQEFVESVLPFVACDIYDGYLRLLALESQKTLEDFGRLMIGFKRAYNITKQLTGDGMVNPSFFREKEEHVLYDLLESNKSAFFAYLRKRDYNEALAVLVSFKESIDNYFEKVFVMDQDETVKNNRLALLKQIKDMFLAYADFSKIRVE
jgi:glycyl-tRNA synthetase beta chain